MAVGAGSEAPALETQARHPVIRRCVSACPSCLTAGSRGPNCQFERLRTCACPVQVCRTNANLSRVLVRAVVSSAASAFATRFARSAVELQQAGVLLSKTPHSSVDVQPAKHAPTSCRSGHYKRH